jgi:hypothetical protein
MKSFRGGGIGKMPQKPPEQLEQLEQRPRPQGAENKGDILRGGRFQRTHKKHARTRALERMLKQFQHDRDGRRMSNIGDIAHLYCLSVGVGRSPTQ